MEPQINSEQIAQSETHIIKQENNFRIQFLLAIIFLVISIGSSAYLYLNQVDLNREIETKDLLLSEHELIVNDFEDQILDHQTHYDDLEGRVNGYLRTRDYECSDEPGICLSKLLEMEIEVPQSASTDSASVIEEL